VFRGFYIEKNSNPEKAHLCKIPATTLCSAIFAVWFVAGEEQKTLSFLASYLLT